MLSRVLREVGDVPLLEALSERLSASDLQSLLLEVFARRSAARGPASVARQQAESRFVRPSTVPQRVQLELDRLIYEALPDGVDDVELSPLAPLGACSALGTVHPDKSIATVRGVEVCSDPTNVLALIAADRRRAALGAARGAGSAPRVDAGRGARDTVRLATSHRIVRPERFDAPQSWAHFRLFALVSAGRGSAELSFEEAALAEHARFHLTLLSRAQGAGYRVRGLQLRITALGGEEEPEAVRRSVAEPLCAEFPGLDFRFAPERTRGRGYYRSLCFEANVVGEDGEVYFLGDGGLTDWTAKLLGDRRERLMISGLGSERFAACLAPRP